MIPKVVRLSDVLEPRIEVGLGPVEKLIIASCLGVFGLSREEMRASMAMRDLAGKPFRRSIHPGEDISGIAPLRSIRQLYELSTGDHDINWTFQPWLLPEDIRSSQDITSSTFSYVLGDGLGRRLVRDYKEYNLLEDLLIGERKPVKDFRTQETVLVGGFPDLLTVDPESAGYQEITGATDEESTYTVGQRGNLLTITRKVVLNDDVGLVLARVRALARAARRTHAKYVWGFFINNSNCSDGTAWFTAGHGNLGSGALSFSTALTAWQALATMTEKDSDEPLGLLADPTVKCALVGPVALTQTLQAIATQPHYFASNDLSTMTVNALAGKVIPYVLPLLSDANDWGLLLPPEAVEHLEVGYLQGRQEPEVIEATAELAEEMLVADKYIYKVRHEYAGAVIDFRGGYKAQVA